MKKGKYYYFYYFLQGKYVRFPYPHFCSSLKDVHDYRKWYERAAPSGVVISFPSSITNVL